MGNHCPVFRGLSCEVEPDRPATRVLNINSLTSDQWAEVDEVASELLTRKELPLTNATRGRNGARLYSTLGSVLATTIRDMRVQKQPEKS